MKKVKLIIADIELFTGKETEILSQIAPYYVEKYKRYKIPEAAKQELVAGYLVKRFLGVDKDEQIVRGEYGKPSLVSGNTFFSLTHSGKYVSIAIADCEVGVDIEKLRPCHDATVKKIFSIRQKAELQELSGAEKDEQFTRIWTECEAILKYLGIGFGKAWDKDQGPLDIYSVETMKVGDYFLSCVTAEKAKIETRKLSVSRISF